ncbi:MAG: serine hydrolase domain-containing protein [Ilumatobacteraceae bacterium]
MGLDTVAVDKLLQRARREVDAGLLPSAQVALAYNGELVAFETFGDATNDTRYVVYSATKAFVAGAVWALIGDGAIDVSKRVADYIPEFASNGKQDITVEQVMLHVSGFPHAPLAVLDGDTSAGRVRAFAKWRLNWEPGTKFEYHASSAHWVLAEIIERVTGADFRDVVQQRVTDPAGLTRVVGGVTHRAAELVAVGEPATPDEMEAAFGVRQFDVGEVTIDALLGFNDPVVQRIGMPGGGGVMRAADLAMYYQAVLHNPGEMWRPDVIADVRGNVRNHLPEVLTGVPANRTLGLVQAGDDGKSNLRGMGHTVSAQTVGHNGAKGQIAWGDPVSGLSLGYCTNGLDRHEVREPRRTSGIASAAGVCVTP